MQKNVLDRLTPDVWSQERARLAGSAKLPVRSATLVSIADCSATRELIETSTFGSLWRRYCPGRLRNTVRLELMATAQTRSDAEKAPQWTTIVAQLTARWCLWRIRVMSITVDASGTHVVHFTDESPVAFA